MSSSRTITKGDNNFNRCYIILFYFILTLTLHNFSCLADIIFISKNKTEAIFENTDLPFGKLNYLGLRGKIKVAEPDEYACSPIKPPPVANGGDTWQGENWIAFIKRSSCSFEVKVRMAMMSNYQAVIIQNNNHPLMTQTEAADNNNDTNSTNHFNHGQLNIPAVMVKYLDGFLIKEHYASDKADYTIILTPRNDDLPMNAYFFPFTTAFVVCLFVLGTFIIVKLSGSTRRRKRRRLSSRDLKQLKTVRFSSDTSCKYETCAICIEDYTEGEQLRILPCHHAFHVKCIDPWLTGNRCVCPICNARVKYSSSDVESDFHSSPGSAGRLSRSPSDPNNYSSPARSSTQSNNSNRGNTSHLENTPLLQGRTATSTSPSTIQSNSVPSSYTQRSVMPKDSNI